MSMAHVEPKRNIVWLFVRFSRVYILHCVRNENQTVKFFSSGDIQNIAKRGRVKCHQIPSGVKKRRTKKLPVYTCPSQRIDFWTLFFEPVSYIKLLSQLIVACFIRVCECVCVCKCRRICGVEIGWNKWKKNTITDI